MSWSERRTGGERRVGCRNKEKEEVKISPGTDRLKIENQKGKDVMRTWREREWQPILGEEPLLFSIWGCSITPNFKGSSLKLCLETGAPTLLLSFFLILLFFTVWLSHWKQVEMLVKEWRGDKGTQRERSAMQSAEKRLPTANKQRFFPESVFFCGSLGSIGDVVSLLFVTDWGV